MSTTKSLIQMKCEACEGWMKPMKREEYLPFLKQVNGWEVDEDRKIKKLFKFKNFKEALNFVNRVGELAEAEQHHPNIYLFGWNKVKISLTTFVLKGLSHNDFIMAAKIDELKI